MVDNTRISERLKNCRSFIHPHKVSVAGRLVRVVGLTLEAVGVKASVGSQCLVETAKGNLIAEVVLHQTFYTLCPSVLNILLNYENLLYRSWICWWTNHGYDRTQVCESSCYRC